MEERSQTESAIVASEIVIWDRDLVLYSAFGKTIEGFIRPIIRANMLSKKPIIPILMNTLNVEVGRMVRNNNKNNKIYTIEAINIFELVPERYPKILIFFGLSPVLRVLNGNCACFLSKISKLSY